MIRKIAQKEDSSNSDKHLDDHFLSLLASWWLNTFSVDRQWETLGVRVTGVVRELESTTAVAASSTNWSVYMSGVGHFIQSD